MANQKIDSLKKIKSNFEAKRDHLLSDVAKMKNAIERKRGEVEKIRKYQLDYGVTAQIEKGNLIPSLTRNRILFLRKLDQLVEIELKHIASEENKCDSYRDLIKKIETKIQSMEILIGNLNLKNGFIEENRLTDADSEIRKFKEEFTNE